MYKMQKHPDIDKYICVNTQKNIYSYSIPLNPFNTDYANFKREINEGKAQLQDADGKLMSADAAKAFVATLP